MIGHVNSVDIIAVTETWLASDIPDNAVDIPNFNLFRKDRNDPIKGTGGGVGAYIGTSHPTRRINDFDNPNIESLWLAIRPHRLSRHTSVILLAVVYHPTDSTTVDNEATPAVKHWLLSCQPPRCTSYHYRRLQPQQYQSEGQCNISTNAMKVLADWMSTTRRLKISAL